MNDHYIEGMNYQAMFALLMLVTASCVTMRDPTLAEKADLVHRRAAFDMKCADTIKLEAIDPKTMDATGCGKQATYFIVCPNPGFPESCSASLASDGHAYP